IDYGTSNSKIVVRDFAAPGGERAHVVLTGDSERLSSSVALLGTDLFFGRRPTDSSGELAGATWYESVKMRVAAEVTGELVLFFRGTPTPYPTGVRAVDLTALTVWWLLDQAHQAARSLVRLRSDEVLVPGMTMGIPMGFLTHSALRAAFVETAR